MNQTYYTKTKSQQLIKDFFIYFWDTCRYAMKDKTGYLDFSDTAHEKRAARNAEVVIGGTTYLVASFFKKNAKGNVVDKISRMIERDAMLSAEKEEVTNTTGMSNRLAL